MCCNTDEVPQCLHSLLQFAYVVVIFVYELLLVIILSFLWQLKLIYHKNNLSQLGFQKINAK